MSQEKAIDFQKERQEFFREMDSVTHIVDNDTFQQVSLERYPDEAKSVAWFQFSYLQDNGKTHLTGADIYINKDEFYLDGEDYTDLIPYIERHEKFELWMFVKEGISVKLNPDNPGEAKHSRETAHRLALRDQYRYAFLHGKADRLLEFDLKSHEKYFREIAKIPEKEIEMHLQKRRDAYNKAKDEFDRKNDYEYIQDLETLKKIPEQARQHIRRLKFYAGELEKGNIDVAFGNIYKLIQSSMSYRNHSLESNLSNDIETYTTSLADKVLSTLRSMHGTREYTSFVDFIRSSFDYRSYSESERKYLEHMAHDIFTIEYSRDPLIAAPNREESSESAFHTLRLAQSILKNSNDGLYHIGENLRTQAAGAVIREFEQHLHHTEDPRIQSLLLKSIDHLTTSEVSNLLASNLLGRMKLLFSFPEFSTDFDSIILEHVFSPNVSSDNIQYLQSSILAFLLQDGRRYLYRNGPHPEITNMHSLEIVAKLLESSLTASRTEAQGEILDVLNSNHRHVLDLVMYEQTAELWTSPVRDYLRKFLANTTFEGINKSKYKNLVELKITLMADILQYDPRFPSTYTKNASHYPDSTYQLALDSYQHYNEINPAVTQRVHSLSNTSKLV